MHVPVLPTECLQGLSPVDGGRYIDATLGGGGHAELLLRAIGPEGHLLGIDRDPEALERVRVRLAPWKDNCTFVHGNFADMMTLAHENGWQEADGILMDLGCSSFQLDEAERGFSFQNDGPLDMRMDPTQERTAAHWVNESSEEELTDMLRRLGEERQARRVAKALVRERAVAPFTNTARLADVAGRAAGGRKGRIHPATRTFQALRMAVNGELESIEAGLEDAMALLRPGGRLAVLSFHSLEDRVVKQAFRAHAGHMESLETGGERWLGREPRVRKITRKPVTARLEEVAGNPRARSAKLRIVEKV